MVESSRESSQLVVQEYLRVLRRRKWIIAALVIVAVGGSFGLTAAKAKVYQASAEVLLEHRSAGSLFEAVKDIGDPTRLPQTEMKVMQSELVRAEVAKRIGSAPAVATSQSGSADIIQLTAENVVPATAALIANTYAQAYIDFRRTGAIDDILAASKQIQIKIDEIQRQIDALSDQARAPGVQSAASIAIISSRSDALISQQNVFKVKLNELQVSNALSSGGAQLVNPATTPTSPVQPRPLIIAVLVGLLALVVGVALAFLLEYLDDSIKTKEHLERAIGTDIPLLGLIPTYESGPSTTGTVAAASSPAGEAYRALRTSVQFLALDGPMVIQVTSASLSEGKTTTVVNLAAVFARAGKRVLLVDCDLRRPRVHDFFKFDNAVGLTSALLNDVPLNSAIQPVPDAGPLWVVASGPRPANPSELLSSNRTKEVLRRLRSSADIVLVDSPPLLPVTDASVLAGHVDGVLLVVMAGATTRRPLQRAVELLRQMRVPVVGAVLTRAGSDDGYGYGYGSSVPAPEPAPGQLGLEASNGSVAPEPTAETAQRVIS